LEVAKGDIIVPFSPDNNSVPELLPQLLEKMKEGYDMVIVSRYKGDAKSEDDDPITAFGNWMFTKMVNILFRAEYTDVLVMYRAFRKDLIDRLKITERKYPTLEAILCNRCAIRKLKVADLSGDEPKRIGSVRKMKPLYNGSVVLWQIFKDLFWS
jgi:glycosyltransferase involved in cell wall biosynthesis